jgi:hypothetical protein
VFVAACHEVSQRNTILSIERLKGDLVSGLILYWQEKLFLAANVEDDLGPCQ